LQVLHRAYCRFGEILTPHPRIAHNPSSGTTLTSFWFVQSGLWTRRGSGAPAATIGMRSARA
jgi:hypothetical protein